MPSELDYIILESLDFIKDNANLKTVHIVKLNEDEIHIGRYETNDIIDSNISVSRKQAIMTYNKDNGKLIMENLSEKFGTLILINGNITNKGQNQIKNDKNENENNSNLYKNYINPKESKKISSDSSDNNQNEEYTVYYSKDLKKTMNIQRQGKDSYGNKFKHNSNMPEYSNIKKTDTKNNSSDNEIDSEKIKMSNNQDKPKSIRRFYKEKNSSNSSSKSIKSE
jgi:hypothetical protein